MPLHLPRLALEAPSASSLRCLAGPFETWTWWCAGSRVFLPGTMTPTRPSSRRPTSSGETQNSGKSVLIMSVHICEVVGYLFYPVQAYICDWFLFFSRSCLHCPYIVQFLGACFDPASQTCSIVNEYMSRGSLYSILHEDKLPLKWKARERMVSARHA